MRIKRHVFNLIQQCQEESFADELRLLRKNKPLYSTLHLLALEPILGDDGLLRLGGRIGRARLPYDQLHPPFLPGRHPLSEKIIRAFHESLKHVGADFLLSYIRQHFWITKWRELVKKIRRDCVVCRRNRALPGEQMMADLIESRLDYGALPFTRTAVDLFGPLEIVMYRNRTAKRWGIIYTCLVTRAVFLELMPSLSSTDFLLLFQKFVSIYRYPEIMHCVVFILMLILSPSHRIVDCLTFCLSWPSVCECVCRLALSGIFCVHYFYCLVLTLCLSQETHL